MSSQDLVGALAFRADEGPGPGPMVVAPPHQWAADGGSGSALLSAAAALIGEGKLAPAGLGAVTTTGPVNDPEAARLYYPVQAGGQEVPASAVSVVAEQDRSIAELRAAAEGRTGVGASPAEVFDPLRLGTLRAGVLGLAGAAGARRPRGRRRRRPDRPAARLGAGAGTAEPLLAGDE